MYINKIKIRNFKCFKNDFSLTLSQGVNVLVGNNEAGKSTIIEAIHLALTGMINGRYLKNELTQYLFNRTVEEEYISGLKSKRIQAPSISIELYFDGEKSPSLEILRGSNNSDKKDAFGVLYCIELDENYNNEYEKLVSQENITTIPIEYYKVTWRSFAQDAVTARSIPIKSALIDSTVTRLQNGSDMYISRIIKDNLEDSERVDISQAHRQLKENFMKTKSIETINQKITKNANLTQKTIKISVDLATQNAWETSLITYLDNIPFQQIGKGEQSIVKTNLALSHKKSLEANLILIEEPENHLSYTKMNELVNRISKNIKTKQILISTHSSFVANKVGLDNLILLHEKLSFRLNKLSKDTREFFLKLSGYDTLRLVLCKKAILVEGDSDELLIQKAYLNIYGRLPIEDGIDVISVGTSFLRFLEIAEKIKKTVFVVTDNDGNIDAVKKKYKSYLDTNNTPYIKICFDETVDTGNMEKFNYNTLEPKLLKSNDRAILNKVFDTSYENDDDLLLYMRRNKTDCALKIFQTTEVINFPKYLLDAIS